MVGKLSWRQWMLAYFGGIVAGAIGMAITGSIYLGIGGAAAFMVGYVFYFSRQAANAAAKNDPARRGGQSTRQGRRAARRRQAKAERKSGG
jgi:hypothetical protein